MAVLPTSPPVPSFRRAPRLFSRLWGGDVLGRPGRGLASQPGPASPVATPGAPPLRPGPAHSRDQLEGPRPCPACAHRGAISSYGRSVPPASQRRLPEPREPAAPAVPGAGANTWLALCPAPGGSASVPCRRVRCGQLGRDFLCVVWFARLLRLSVCASVRPSVQLLFPERWHLWASSDKASLPSQRLGARVSEPWVRSPPSARPGGAVASQPPGPGLTTPGWPWSPGVC